MSLSSFSNLFMSLLSIVVMAQGFAQTNCLPSGTLPQLPTILDPVSGEKTIDLKNLDPNILSSENGFGGWAGSGGSTHNETDNTWYVGPGKINYCVRVAEDYPFSKEELTRIVSRSFLDWTAFFRKYRITNSPLGVEQDNFSVRLPDGQVPTMSLGTNLVDCDKMEIDALPGETLMFFFGLTNTAIKVYQNFNTENAYGLAVRPKYNHKTRRNGGYVWIKEFERSEESKLRHMVLHELGHVFGMRHDSVFVMSEDVVDELENKDLFTADYFGEIESAGWKYRYQPNDPAILSSNKGRRFKDGVIGSPANGDWSDLSNFEASLYAGWIPKKWKKPHPTPNPNPNKPHNPPNNNTYGAYKCQDEAYSPNDILPAAVTRQFGLKPGGCHKITFNRLPSAADNNSKRFELEIAEPVGGKQLSFKGQFTNQDNTREDDLGPGVYTTYKVTRGNQGMSRLVGIRLPLDREEDELPVKGKFEVGNKSFAAQIFNDKGPVVQVFLPEVGRWWTMRSVHSCRGNGPCRDEE